MTEGKVADSLETRGMVSSPSLARRVASAIAGTRSIGLAFVLAILIALFALRAPGFATFYNFNDTLRDLSILGLLAIGETVVLIGGGVDLSVGSVLLIAGI